MVARASSSKAPLTIFSEGPAAPSALHRVKAHSPVTSTSFHCSGWWGLHNIFSRRGDDAPEASTFAWTEADADHVRGVVDEMRSFGADVILALNLTQARKKGNVSWLKK